MLFSTNSRRGSERGLGQWRNKVAVGPRASIPKGPPLPQKNFKKTASGKFWAPTALGPRALHALHALLLRHWPRPMYHVSSWFSRPSHLPRLLMLDYVWLSLSSVHPSTTKATAGLPWPALCRQLTTWRLCLQLSLPLLHLTSLPKVWFFHSKLISR